MAYKLDIYKDGRGNFRWRRISKNGIVVEASSDSFKSRKACTDSINTVGWKVSESISRVEKMELPKAMAGQFVGFDEARASPLARRAALMKSYGKPRVANE